MSVDEGGRGQALVFREGLRTRRRMLPPGRSGEVFARWQAWLLEDARESGHLEGQVLLPAGRGGLVLLGALLVATLAALGQLLAPLPLGELWAFVGQLQDRERHAAVVLMALLGGLTLFMFGAAAFGMARIWRLQHRARAWPTWQIGPRGLVFFDPGGAPRAVALRLEGGSLAADGDEALIPFFSGGPVARRLALGLAARASPPDAPPAMGWLHLRVAVLPAILASLAGWSMAPLLGPSWGPWVVLLALIAGLLVALALIHAHHKAWHELRAQARAGAGLLDELGWRVSPPAQGEAARPRHRAGNVLT